MKYQSNNPKRRIAKPGSFTERQLDDLASTARYEGSAHHKTRPADYGFTPAVAPRPSKSVCDDRRVILREEAKQLLRSGIRLGMVSSCLKGDWPKYVWAVDNTGEVYEAKLGHDGRRYHGYRMKEDDAAMRKSVLDEWSKRTTGHSRAATE